MTGPQVVLLHEDEERVIDAMDPDYGRPFTYLSEETGLTVKEVRKIVRGLKEQGLVEYGPLYDEHDCCVRGSGYWLNRYGHAIQCRRREARRTPRVEFYDEALPMPQGDVA